VADKTITVNRKAQHDYHILERLEAGIALTGTEIKAIRDGRVNLRDAYARPERGEMWLVGAHIGPYAAAGRFNHEPGRRRKLLLHRKQIVELGREVEEKGLPSLAAAVATTVAKRSPGGRRSGRCGGPCDIAARR